MKKTHTSLLHNHPVLKKILTILAWCIGILTILALIIALVIWVLWPVRQTSLQSAAPQKLSFAQAQQQIESIAASERKAGVKPECISKAYVHSEKTARSVLMLHGVSACPSQFSHLAEYFYARGYNVYTARAPHHGMGDNTQHGKVTSQELADFVNQSVNITQGLGKEMGVIGLSGGANLSTWAAHYRPEVTRILALSPFYEPSALRAPKWQIRPLVVLHGNNILPEQLNNPDDPQHALSYRALAKYVTLYKNLKKDPKNTGLQKVALIMADDDLEIDQGLAQDTLNTLAKANGLRLARTQIAPSYKLGHDIVGPTNPQVVVHEPYLLDLYFRSYNN